MTNCGHNIISTGLYWGWFWHNEDQSRVSLRSTSYHSFIIVWPRRKYGRHMHAQSSLLQRAPRRKAWSWCFKKALERPAEETACTGRNQLSVMAWGSLRPRQLAFISEKNQSKFEAKKHKATKKRPRRQKEPTASASTVCTKCRRVFASTIGLYSHQRACKNWPQELTTRTDPQATQILVCDGSAIIIT